MSEPEWDGQADEVDYPLCDYCGLISCGLSHFDGDAVATFEAGLITRAEAERRLDLMIWRDSAADARLVHAQEEAGSTPVPATSSVTHAAGRGDSDDRNTVDSETATARAYEVRLAAYPNLLDSMPLPGPPPQGPSQRPYWQRSREERMSPKRKAKRDAQRAWLCSLMEASP